MYISDFFRTMGRRWYLVVLGVAATAGLGVLAVQQVPPTYEIEGRALLLPPASVVGEGGNPFLELGGLEQVVDVLVKYLDSDVERERVAEQIPTVEYEVARDSSTAGPIIVFAIEDPTPEGALDAVELLLDSVPVALTTLQDSVGVPDGADVTSMTLTSGTEPTPSRTSTVRAVLVAVAAGLLLTAALVALLDAWILRRRERTAVRRSAFGPAGDGPRPEPQPDPADAVRPEEVVVGSYSPAPASMDVVMRRRRRL